MFQLTNVFGKKPTVDLSFLVACAKEKEREISTTALRLETLRAELLAIKARADEAGLSDKLAAALEPPLAPVPIPHVRVRAIKAYREIFRGPRGSEEYSGGPNSVNDIPSELLPKLKGRVEVVPATTEIHGVPLEDWMNTTD